MQNNENKRKRQDNRNHNHNNHNNHNYNNNQQSNHYSSFMNSNLHLKKDSLMDDGNPNMNQPNIQTYFQTLNENQKMQFVQMLFKSMPNNQSTQSTTSTNMPASHAAYISTQNFIKSQIENQDLTEEQKQKKKKDEKLIEKTIKITMDGNHKGCQHLLRHDLLDERFLNKNNPLQNIILFNTLKFIKWMGWKHQKNPQQTNLENYKLSLSKTSFISSNLKSMIDSENLKMDQGNKNNKMKDVNDAFAILGDDYKK